MEAEFVLSETEPSQSRAQERFARQSSSQCAIVAVLHTWAGVLWLELLCELIVGVGGLCELCGEYEGFGVGVGGLCGQLKISLMRQG